MVHCAFHFEDPHVRWIPNHQKNLNKIQVWHQIYSKSGCPIKLMPALWKATATYMQTTSKLYNNKEFHLHLKEILDIQLLLSRIKLVIYNKISLFHRVYHAKLHLKNILAFWIRVIYSDSFFLFMFTLLIYFYKVSSETMTMFSVIVEKNSHQ